MHSLGSLNAPRRFLDTNILLYSIGGDPAEMPKRSLLAPQALRLALAGATLAISLLESDGVALFGAGPAGVLRSGNPPRDSVDHDIAPASYALGCDLKSKK